MSAPEALAGIGLTLLLHTALLMTFALLACALLRERGLPWQEALCRFALWGGIASGLCQWFLCGGPVLGPTGSAPPTAPAEPVTPALMPLPVSPAAEPASVALLAPAQLLALAAAALAAGGLLALARARLRLHSVLSRRRREADPRILASARAVAGTLGLDRPFRLSRCKALVAPVAFGWLRPEVCLPERAAELEDHELRAMLAHELAHLQRRDPAWLWLGAVLQALLPWHLLLPPLRRRLADLAELRCDATAGRCAGPLAVARCLVRVAGWLGEQRRPSPAVALGMAARPSMLKRRVDAALRGGDDRPVPQRAMAAAAGAALVLLVAAAPGARPPAEVPGDLATLAPPRRLSALPPGVAPAGLAARAALAERDELVAEVAALRARLAQRSDDHELQLLAAQLEIRLQRLAEAGDRLAAALARSAQPFDPNR